MDFKLSKYFRKSLLDLKTIDHWERDFNVYTGHNVFSQAGSLLRNYQNRWRVCFQGLCLFIRANLIRSRPLYFAHFIALNFSNSQARFFLLFPTKIKFLMSLGYTPPLPPIPLRWETLCIFYS